jgi:hypothetical protein
MTTLDTNSTVANMIAYLREQYPQKRGSEKRRYGDLLHCLESGIAQPETVPCREPVVNRSGYPFVLLRKISDCGPAHVQLYKDILKKHGIDLALPLTRDSSIHDIGNAMVSAADDLGNPREKATLSMAGRALLHERYADGISAMLERPAYKTLGDILDDKDNATKSIAKIEGIGQLGIALMFRFLEERGFSASQGRGRG